MARSHEQCATECSGSCLSEGSVPSGPLFHATAHNVLRTAESELFQCAQLPSPWTVATWVDEKGFAKARSTRAKGTRWYEIQPLPARLCQA